MNLPPKRSEIRVTAEVLESIEVKGFYPYRTRCKFVGLDAQVASQLNAQVMKYQRISIQDEQD
jgi:hypothetical protein